MALHSSKQRAFEPPELWYSIHVIPQESPQVRTSQNRSQLQAQLRGLTFGSDGRAMSLTYTRGRQGQLYRYYVSKPVLKGGAADGPVLARIAAAEIEGSTTPT